jgi:hypothetical protein
MKVYGVATMDIVGSGKIKEREQFQNKLNNYIEQLNQKYSSILAAPISSITAGDEWQLITSNLSMLYDLVHEFQQLLWADKEELYAGIGIGFLKTELHNDIGRIDGSCFNMARKALCIAKGQTKSKHKFIYSKNNRVYFIPDPILEENLRKQSFSALYPALSPVSTETGFTNSLSHSEVAATTEMPPNSLKDNESKYVLSNLINILIENNEILKSKMTEKQKKVYLDYVTYGTYRRILEAYGNSSNESIGGIGQKLNTAEFFTIRQNRIIIGSMLNIYMDMGV